MGHREDSQIPDWVVDDYNSRVSEEDRLPLDGTKKYGSIECNHTSDETTVSRHTNIQYDRTVSDMISDWIDDNQFLTWLLIIIFSAGVASFLVN